MSSVNSDLKDISEKLLILNSQYKTLSQRINIFSVRLFRVGTGILLALFLIISIHKRNLLFPLEKQRPKVQSVFCFFASYDKHDFYKYVNFKL